MLINIPNTDSKSPVYGKIRADIMKALDFKTEWDKVKWPLPHLKEVEEKTFWSHAMMYSFTADVHGDTLKVDNDWYNCHLYWVNHGSLIDGGFAVLYRYDWKRERVRYFKWSTCDHNFLGKTVGRCLTRYTCEKCNKSYEIDSSD